MKEKRTPTPVAKPKLMEKAKVYSHLRANNPLILRDEEDTNFSMSIKKMMMKKKKKKNLEVIHMNTMIMMKKTVLSLMRGHGCFWDFFYIK